MMLLSHVSFCLIFKLYILSHLYSSIFSLFQSNSLFLSSTLVCVLFILSCFRLIYLVQSEEAGDAFLYHLKPMYLLSSLQFYSLALPVSFFLSFLHSALCSVQGSSCLSSSWFRLAKQQRTTTSCFRLR